MNRRRFDPVHILSRLQAHGVRFVLIGGLAAKAHGSPTLTVDIDVCYARDRDNLERLAAVLGSSHLFFAEPRQTCRSIRIG